MKRPEILSPAGDLERLKFAVLYGADAVYVGATEFGHAQRAEKFHDGAAGRRACALPMPEGAGFI